MAFNEQLAIAFAKATDDSQTPSSSYTCYGTIQVSSGQTYVLLDGAKTPIEVAFTMGAEDGDRVTCLVDNHKVMVTGNLTHPAEGMTANYIETLGIIAGEAAIGKLIATDADFSNLTADSAFIKKLFTGEVSAELIKAEQLDIGYLSVDSLAAEEGNFDKINALSAFVQRLYSPEVNAELIKAEQAEIGFLNVGSLAALEGDFAIINANSAFVKQLVATGIISTDTLQAEFAKIKSASIDVAGVETLYTQQEFVNYVVANYASIDLANIDVLKANDAVIAQLLAKVALISDATIVNGHVTGYLDSVEINADKITAGTLVADRILLRGTSENGSSLLYLLNYDPNKEEIHTETLDGDVITDRTVTADKLVAKSITSNEIAAGTITSNEIAAGTIKAENIDTSTLTTDIIKFGNQDVNLTSFLDTVTTTQKEVSSDVNGINLVLQRDVDKIKLTNTVDESSSIEDYSVDETGYIPTLRNYPCYDYFYDWQLSGELTIDRAMPPFSDGAIMAPKLFKENKGKILKVGIELNAIYYIFDYSNYEKEYYWRKMTNEEIEALADKKNSIQITDDGVLISSKFENVEESLLVKYDGIYPSKLYCC